MPDSNLADNSVLTSSFYNTYVREQVVVTCTSGTRPTGVEGRLIYETDTAQYMTYNGSSWVPLVRATGIQSGTRTGTTTSAGKINVTFSASYVSAPVVVCNVRVATARVAVIESITTSGFTAVYRQITDGATLNSTAIDLEWIAVGTLA